MVIVEPDDELVYALRIVGEERDFILLSVAEAKGRGLRKASSATEIEIFLDLLQEVESDAANKKVTAPEDLMSAVFKAGNDLAMLARLYPHLRRATGDQPHLERTRSTLETFFVDEIAIAKSASTEEAKRLLQETAP